MPNQVWMSAWYSFTGVVPALQSRLDVGEQAGAVQAELEPLRVVADSVHLFVMLAVDGRQRGAFPP
jgi:hypothetical protein